MLNRIRLNQTGDTIVEVLIAVAVVSVVLVAAYTTTTRNTNALQDTEEHSEALQLAQTQLEYLHDTAAGDRPAGSLTAPACFDDTGKKATANSCKVDSSGVPTSLQPQFQLNVVPETSPAGVYDVVVTWSGLNGTANKVALFYQP